MPQRARNTLFAAKAWLWPILFWSMALLPLLALGAQRAQAPFPHALNDLIADDAYYYFGIARNIVEGHGSSFGLISQTNGYHPLWLILLLPLIGFAGSAESVLALSMLLGGFAWLIICVVLWRIARHAALDVPVVLAMPLLIFVFTHAFPASHGLLFLGMESTILLPLLFMLVALILRWSVFHRTLRRVEMLGISVLAALIILARLDAVFLIAGFFAVILLRCHGGHGVRGLFSVATLRTAGPLLLPVLVTVAIYCSVNLWQFGVLMPVSGSAKSLPYEGVNISPLLSFLAVAPSAAQVIKYLPLSLGFVTLLGVLAILPGRSADRAACDDPHIGQAREALLLFVLALMIGQALHLVYLCTLSSWPIWPWYFYHTAMAVAILLPLAMARVLHSLWTFLSVERLALMGGLALAASVVAALWHVERRVSAMASPQTYWVYGIDAARDLDRRLPADAVLAMGDLAGTLGYNVNRPLLQLEGLVEDRAYLDVLAQHGAHGVVAYMARVGVTHIAATNFNLQDRPDLPAGCGLLVEPKLGFGPKVTVVVCAQDAVYQRLGMTVWLFRMDRQALHPATAFGDP